MDGDEAIMVSLKGFLFDMTGQVRCHGRPAATIPANIAHTALLTFRDAPKQVIDSHEELTPQTYLQLYVTTKREQPVSKPPQSHATTRTQTKSLAEQIQDRIPKQTDSKPKTEPKTKRKASLPKNWYDATVIGHQGEGEHLRFLIRWDGYAAEHDTWVHPKDISEPAIKEYYDKLTDKPSLPTRSSISPLTSRILPKDVINGDYTHIDPFAEIPDRRHQPDVTDPSVITILPQQHDFQETSPYNGSTYTQLTPTDVTTPEVKTSSARSFIGHNTRRALDAASPPLTGTITDYDRSSNTFTITHDDGEIEYMDPETIHQYLIQEGSTFEENRNSHLLHCLAIAQTQAKTLFDDEPRGRRAAQAHPEAEAIMASEEKEISFYKMRVMKNVKISDLPRGTNLLPLHMNYKRKYTIDEKTKLNVFAKWKARLVIGGNRQKEHDCSFAPTPSWSSIRLALAYSADPSWKTVSYDLASAFCRVPLKGRAIYVRPPAGLAPPGMCWQLLHSIYGLIEAAADYSKLRNEIILTFEHNYHGHKLRFTQTDADPCLFVMHDEKQQPILILVAYIDDLILSYKIEYIKNAFVQWLDRTWEVSDPEPLNRYLGIHFRREEDGSWNFDAEAYIEKACHRS